MIIAASNDSDKALLALESKTLPGPYNYGFRKCCNDYLDRLKAVLRHARDFRKLLWSGQCEWTIVLRLCVEITSPDAILSVLSLDRLTEWFEDLDSALLGAGWYLAWWQPIGEL